MKNTFFVLFLIILSSTGFSQNKPTIVNRIKLFVVNDKNEFLLVKWHGKWELPGSVYGDSSIVKPINSFLDNMVSDCGITLKEKKLAGIFTYYLNNNQYPVIYTYYKARYKSGNIKPGIGLDDVKWFPFLQGLNTIPYPNSIAIVKEITQYPQYIWGGAFKVYPGESWRYEVIDDFYHLN